MVGCLVSYLVGVALLRGICRHEKIAAGRWAKTS